jgi:hypothetical protein
MPNEHNQPPPWVIDHAHKVKRALGLQEFGVWLEMVDEIDGEPTVAGACKTNYRYLWANIRLRRDIENTAEGREYITHEILHAALFRLDQAVDSIIQLVPKALKEHSRDLWTDGNEQTVSVLARALTPLLDSVDTVPDTGPSDGPQSAPDPQSKGGDIIGGRLW